MESQKRTAKIFILGKLQNLLQRAEPLQFLNKGSFQSEKLLKVQPLYRSSTFLLIQLFANDLTVFFMNYIYRVPAHHFFNFMRCFLGLLCFKAVGEYCQWLQGRQKMHGIYLYLLSCILVLELALIYKHKEDGYLRPCVHRRVWEGYLSSLCLTFFGIARESCPIRSVCNSISVQIGRTQSVEGNALEIPVKSSVDGPNTQ